QVAVVIGTLGGWGLGHRYTISRLSWRCQHFAYLAFREWRAGNVDIDNLTDYGSCQRQHLIHLRRSPNMRSCILLLMLLVVLAGCKPEDAPTALRLVRTLVVDPKSIGEDRHAIGE